MINGLYEEIVNKFLENKIEPISEKRKHLKLLNASDSNDYLAQYLYKVLAQGLAQVKGEESEKLKTQIDICNEVLSVLSNNDIDVEGFEVSNKASKLIRIMDEALTYRERPDTPLAFGALLTGTRQDPALVSQLKKEIASCDEIDILCSFIRWSGIVILREAFEEFSKRKKSNLRIITTSYMGATETKAIEYLNSLPNTQIKVSYDTKRTRLHAKAYLFERKTGFSCAYVGSSNISGAALTDGLEWNVKISQYEQPYQWEKVKATFDTYWNDGEFELYNQTDKEKLGKALASAKLGGSSFDKNENFVMPSFDFNPHPFQKEILENIYAERELGRRKHLIIAATGTGKTMIAAFDFKRFRKKYYEDNRKEPKLLFIAHREEILKQSLYTFKAVLRDQNLGDIMVGGNIPTQMEQVFVSIQTYNSKALYDSIDPDYYDYIVVDEFHHAAAPSYRKLLEHVNPKSLLGLTATPERTDGLDIKYYFDEHITAEIRLPDAIDRKLLSPFQYFGITDNVDYTNIKWQRGRYLSSELTNIYTADDYRAKMILRKTAETVLDIRRSKGLGFCVSKDHAKFMSDKFNEHGVPSEFLTADSDRITRNTVQQRLLNCDINFIFVVDLYNEGVDIPEIDTVLFLRPTESLTIFLQQLGRGLRLVDGKDCLTVLDFVGQANKNYRYDLKYSALMSKPGINLSREIENDFPHLPAGCAIELERKSKEFILENIRQSLKLGKSTIVKQLISFVEDTGKTLTFENYLEAYKLEPFDIYRKVCWSRVQVEAGFKEAFSDPDEEKLTDGLRNLCHIEDVNYIEYILSILENGDVNISSLTELQRMYCTMFFLSVFVKEKFNSIEDAYIKLLDNPTMCHEIIMLLMYIKNNIKHVSPKVSLPYKCALGLHFQYSQAEALAGLGYFSLKENHTVQSGVLHYKKKSTDIFFITLNKNEEDYSPTTMYKDYAISEELFHWQSQASTRELSTTGQRYINHKEQGQTILLFVREYKNANNVTSTYYFLGPVDYVSHEGECPISFVWRMRYPMPAHLVRQTARLSVG